MKTVKIPSEQYVELYSSIAEQLMVTGSSMSEFLIEIDGVEMFTDEGQDIFNHYADVACALLEANGIESENINQPEGD